MSTLSKSSAQKSRPVPSKPDLYRYGWRYVPVTRQDGTEVIDQVPLTLEDVLHPEVGDFIVETDSHDGDRAYLKNAFKWRTADDPEALVLANCRVDWNLPGVRPLGPDVAVFFGVKRYIDWETFDVAAEAARPALVVEITSRATRKNDLGVKLDFYHQAKVPIYLIADALGRGAKRRLKLIGYQYARERYKPIAPDKNGRIYLEPVRLWVGIKHDPRGGYDRLVCFDADTGEELGDYASVLEQARAEAEARAQAEARVRELEAQLKQLRASKP